MLDHLLTYPAIRIKALKLFNTSHRKGRLRRSATKTLVEKDIVDVNSLNGITFNHKINLKRMKIDFLFENIK